MYSLGMSCLGHRSIGQAGSYMGLELRVKEAFKEDTTCQQQVGLIGSV